jgi:dienelactone hydrolase
MIHLIKRRDFMFGLASASLTLLDPFSLSSRSRLNAQTTNTLELNVSNGSFNTSNLANVWANPPALGQAFNGWTGDTAELISPLDYHTTLNTASGEFNLAATYKDTPVWTSQQEIISGTTVAYYFPSTLIGVIVLLHGKGGSGPGWFQKADNLVFTKDAVATGYAVVALDSQNRSTKQWDNSTPPPNNPDIQNVQDVLNTFISQGLMSSSTPVFAAGMSNGGGVAPTLSLALGFKATAVYCAPGKQDVFSVTSVPTTWNLAQNDTSVSPKSSHAFSNYQTLLSRGIDTDYFVNQPSPLYPFRFAAIPELTTDDSQIIYEAFVNANPPLLDTNGYLLADPTTSNGWLKALPLRYLPYSNDIQGQLLIAYTQHHFYADRNRTVLAFFDAHR